jgi:hypothetical protein
MERLKFPNTLHIAFQGGTHGHFLRHFLDRFSKHTPAITQSPFTELGTSHKEINYSENFDRYHPIPDGFRNSKEPHCVITLSKQDVLQLQRIVYIRPADLNLDTNNNKIKLPKNFMDSAGIEKLYKIKIDDNIEIPKFILRDHVKLGFSDIDKHGFIINNEILTKHKLENVHYFPVSCFWDKEKFFNQLKILNEKFSLDLFLGNDAKDIYEQFIEKMPQLKTRNRCENIISAIKEKRDIPILNLDIIEEAYIYSWIETSYKNVLAPFTNSFFKRTADINDYIKWYPHFYHGMNPTLPNKIT